MTMAGETLVKCIEIYSIHESWASVVSAGWNQKLQAPSGTLRDLYAIWLETRAKPGVLPLWLNSEEGMPVMMPPLGTA